jgi:hypothetical protein
MQRISDLVLEEVRRSAFLEAALADGLINHSALARRLKPRIERRLLRKVSSAAVMMALRRLDLPTSSRAAPVRRHGPVLGEITVRSRLMEYTFHNSSTLRDKQRRLLARLARVPDAFLTYTQGVSEAMLIVSAGLERVVDEVFAGEHRVATLRGLSALVLRLPGSAIKTPGTYYRILKQLAWEHINVVDIVSTYSELTIVIHDGQVDTAFSAMRGL